MKKIAFHFCIFLISINYCIGQSNPLITSWQVNTTGATGYMGYTTNVKQVLYSNTFVYIKTNDIADYIPSNAGLGMGQVDWWPNNPWFPDSMGYTFKFRLNPTENKGTLTKPPFGHIGVWRNGVSIYNWTLKVTMLIRLGFRMHFFGSICWVKPLTFVGDIQMDLVNTIPTKVQLVYTIRWTA